MVGEDEVVQLFIDESREHLATIEEDLLAIEQSGEHCPDSLINRTFRAIHTIKGSSSFFPLKNIKNLTHVMENILGKIRSKELLPDTEIISVLLDSADSLKTMINNLDKSEDVDVSGYIEKLHRFCQGNNERTDTIPRHDMQDSVPVRSRSGKLLTRLPRKKIALMQHATNGGRFVYLLEIMRKELCSPGRSIEATLALCKQMASIHEITEHSDKEDCFCFVCTTNVEKEMLLEILELPADTLSEVMAGRIEEPLPEVSDDEHSGQIEHALTIKQENKAGKETTLSAPDRAIKQKSSLRVSISILDRLMSLAGELVLTRNQLVQNASTKNYAAFLGATQRVDSITSELQEAIMATRMQSIGIVFSKFKRMVRDISQSLGKDVDLQIEGEHVELDKSIIEIIGDPLTHLVRNAIDHGIETPSERESAGKPSQGTLRLKATHEAGQVIIEIMDDGAGIDAEKVAAKAQSLGLLDEVQLARMSERDIIKLIFRPGFSTAERVTDISGRGVGMDVVQSNLGKVGGAIDVESAIGKGTSIRIKLPLTLAIIPSLLVSVGEERYAIPQVNLVELVRLSAGNVRERIENISGAAVLRLRDELLPLVRVSDFLDIGRFFLDRQSGKKVQDRREAVWDRRSSALMEAQPEENRRTKQDRRKSHQSAVIIVVVAAGEFKYGLVVDALLDSAEIVVKPLGYHLCGCREYAGATILGDGRVALILDVVGIKEMLDLQDTQSALQTRSSQSTSTVAMESFHSLLLVENARDELFAVPLGFVSRIEKITTAAISWTGGRPVIPYRGGSLPLFSIESVANVKPRHEQKHAYIIVFQAGGREMGIVVSDIIDTIEFSEGIDETTHVQPGILGSAIIENRIVLLLDIFAIVHQAAPDLFANLENASRKKESRKYRVLIVEDSVFFLNQIRAFVEDAGYEVVTAEDGVKGLAVLNNAAEPFDLVLTDIEMPNMDGLCLTREIRSSQRYRNLPVIAVTSVIGKTAEKRAQEAGIDAYLIKLDKEKVLDACKFYCTRGRSCQ